MFEFNATLIVAMISFVVFMFIMNAIFYRPILNIIRKRDELVEQNYENAKVLANKAQEINNEYQTKLGDVKEQARNEIAKEIEIAQKESFEKTHNAKEQAKIQIQNNKDYIETEKAKLFEKVNSDIVEDISSEIFKKIVG